MPDTDTTATFARLRSGQWGLRITGPVPTPGTPITVTRRDGSTDTARVGEIVWRGDGVSLVMLARDSAPRRSPPIHVNSCDHCGRPTRGTLCGACDR